MTAFGISTLDSPWKTMCILMIWIYRLCPKVNVGYLERFADCLYVCGTLWRGASGAARRQAVSQRTVNLARYWKAIAKNEINKVRAERR